MKSFSKNIKLCPSENEVTIKNKIERNQSFSLVYKRGYGKTVTIMSALSSQKKKFVYINLSKYQTIKSFVLEISKRIANDYFLTDDISNINKSISELKDYFYEIKPKINIEMDDKLSVEFVIKDEKLALLELAEILHKLSQRKNLYIVIDDYDFHMMFAEFVLKLSSDLKSKNGIFLGSKTDQYLDYISERINRLPFTEINEKHWFIFLQKFLKDSKLKIKPDIINSLISYSNCHPYYIMKIIDDLSKNEYNDFSILMDEVIKKYDFYFKNMLDQIVNKSDNQFKTLMLLSETNGQNIYRSTFLKKYDLTKSSVERCLHSFLNQNIIDRKEDRIIFINPIFSYWLSNFS